MHAHDAEQVQRYRSLAELVPAHWQRGSIEAEDGTPLHYVRTGAGTLGVKPPVLLVHGLQVDGAMWLRTAQALEAGYDLIMPDLRGHGRSGAPNTPWSSADMLQDLIALLGVLRIHNPFVVGHSLGADLAGRLAASVPVRGVVLADPALRSVAAAPPAQTDAPPVWMQPLIDAMQTLRTQAHRERMVTGLRLVPPGTAPWHEADYVAFVDGHARFRVATYRAIATMRPLVDDPAIIEQIRCSILLLTARPLLPGLTIDAGVAVFERHWREGQHMHVAHSGHFIPFDQFDRFVAVLLRFFREH